MALPTVATLKSTLRVQVSDEDALFAGWLTRATALVDGFLQQGGNPPLVAVETDYTLIPACHPVFGPGTLLALPVRPISAVTADVSVVDENGDTVATTDYTVDGAKGWIIADVMDDIAFDSAYYTVTVKPGLDKAADYATRIEPLVSQAITDLVSDWYNHRDADASQVSAGGGLVVTYKNTGLPARVVLTLQPLLPPRVR